MADVEGFLEALQCEGAAVSDGAFTLNPKLARKKLQAFQEELPAYSLLRVVQGLHLLRAERIDVKIGRRKLEILASCPQALLEPIRSAFFAGAGLSKDGPSVIAAGLNAACLAPDPKLQVGVGGYAWEPLADRTSPRESDPEFHLEVALPGGRLKSTWLRVQLQREVAKRCRFSPCPFWLDGRQLEPDWEGYKNSDGEQSVIAPHLEWLVAGEGFRFVLGDLVPYQAKGDALLWSRSEPEPLSRYRKRFFPALIYAGIGSETDGQSIGCRLVLTHFEGDQQACQVQTICHGVVAELFTEPEWLPSTYVLMDVSDLETDLSGLKVIRDEAYQERCDEVEQLMHQAVGLVHEHAGSVVRPYLISAIPDYLTRNLWMGPLWRRLSRRLLKWAASTRHAATQLAKHNETLDRWSRSRRETQV